MSNINDISIDKIETDIMSVLYANMDYTFTQYSLFNKLLIDKYDFSNKYLFRKNLIHQNFKSKFLLIIRNLVSKYDNIKITKENSIYNIVCLSSQNVIPIQFTNSLENNKINEPYEPNELNESNKPNELNELNELNEHDISMMYDYLYENNPNDYLTWSDQIDGNSIFHELVLNNNQKQIERLINENTFNYTIKNNYNQTPIDFIKTPQIAKILTIGLVKKLNSTKEKLIQEKENIDIIINNFNNKMTFYESDKYKNEIIDNTDFYDIILIKIKKYNIVKMYLMAFVIMYMSYYFH